MSYKTHYQGGALIDHELGTVEYPEGDGGDSEDNGNAQPLGGEAKSEEKTPEADKTDKTAKPSVDTVKAKETAKEGSDKASA